MIVLLDLLRNGPAAESWLNSVRVARARPLNVQRLDQIGIAILDATDAEVASAPQGVRIYPNGSLRPFSSVPAGRLVRFDKLTKSLVAPWNLAMIGQPLLTGRGEGVRVGHIDTGIDPLHPALRGRPAGYCTFRWNGANVLCDPTASPEDEPGHGTKTASLICGEPPFGVAGGVELYTAALVGYPWKDAMVAAAIDWLLTQSVQIIWFGIERPNETSPFYDDRMTWLLDDKNILPVVAIGNEGKDCTATPGNTLDGLSVGAVGQQSGIPYVWSDSSSGLRQRIRRPDVVAPGDNVSVAIFYERPSGPEPNAALDSGTSFAGPHVVGLAAILRGEFSTVPARQLKKAIQDGSNLSGLLPERVGHGIPYGPAIYDILKAQIHLK